MSVPSSSKSTSTDLTHSPKTKTPSLGSYVAELESVCSEIDSADEITDEMLARFDDAKLSVALKVDRYISFLEAGKLLTETLHEREKRIRQARKTAEGLVTRLKEYVKDVIQSTEGRTVLKGAELGGLHLQRNAEALEVDFTTEEKTTYKVIDMALPSIEPSLEPYVKMVSYAVLNTEKLKADIKAGMRFPWARLTRDFHIRIRG